MAGMAGGNRNCIFERDAAICRVMGYLWSPTKRQAGHSIVTQAGNRLAEQLRECMEK
jgi:hypothetical protein